jgi:hypothetical protein
MIVVTYSGTIKYACLDYKERHRIKVKRRIFLDKHSEISFSISTMYENTPFFYGVFMSNKAGTWRGKYSVKSDGDEREKDLIDIRMEEKNSILEVSGKWPEEGNLYDMKIDARAEQSQEFDEDDWMFTFLEILV